MNEPRRQSCCRGTSRLRSAARRVKGLARPDGFEPPTTAFEAQYSIQLSYGRAEARDSASRTQFPQPFVPNMSALALSSLKLLFRMGQ